MSKTLQCFDDVNVILREGGELQGEPGHPMTRRMFAIAGAIAALPGNPARPDVLHMAPDASGHNCFQTELYFVRSFRQVSARRRPYTDHLPAAILHDENGPFAYQKASGRHTAFAWRDSLVPTRAGRRFIPGGFLFELQYGELPVKGERRWYPRDPRLAMVHNPNNTGLVQYRPTEADDVILGRLSTQYVPRMMRFVLHGMAAAELNEDYGVDLSSFRGDATLLTNRYVSQKAAWFLARGRVAELPDHL